MLRYSDLFFMGAAFLLLETKSVVQFALLFGTTWFVNALVFLGVLLSVLGRCCCRSASRSGTRAGSTWCCSPAWSWRGRCRSSACCAWRSCPASSWR